LDEREAKYKAVTANIQESLKKSVPVRQTKLAYVEVAKPPRNILRKQVGMTFSHYLNLQSILSILITLDIDMSYSNHISEPFFTLPQPGPEPRVPQFFNM